MEYRSLGKSSLKISRVAFGGMSLEAGGETLLQQALDLGINYFDTADIYQQGMNEEMIGRAFRGRRKEVILATKAGNEKMPGGTGWHWNPRRKHLVSALEASLHRLGTDYVDLFQLHGGTLQDPIDEVIGTFESLRQQGKIRYYGISSIRPEVIREYVKRSSIVSVMMQYSLLDRRPEETVFDLLRGNDIGVLARGSLAKGMLLSKPAEQFLNYTSGDVTLMAQRVAQLSGEKRDAAGTALQFVLGNPAITSAVVGIRTEAQLTEAVQAVTAPAVTTMERESLSAALEINCYTEFR